MLRAASGIASSRQTVGPGCAIGRNNHTIAGADGIVLVLPPLVVWVTRRICLGLKRSDEIDHDRERAEEEAKAAGAPA